MLKFILLFLGLLFFVFSSKAMNFYNYVPDFLMPGAKESSDVAALPEKQLLDEKLNASGVNTRSCNQDEPSSVFCNNDSITLQNHESINYNNDKNSDKTKMVDISTSAKTSSNQSAMQDQHTRDALQQQQNNLFVPIKPSKNVDVNVGQQQVQIKIKY